MAYNDSLDKRKEAASIRRKIKALLGNECFICGYKVCLKALELHHLDPSRKKFNISMNVLRYKWSTLVKECLECILVCNRCHVEVEEGVITIDKKDIPREYYIKILNSIKSAKNKFKSKSYARQKKGASPGGRSHKDYRRSSKKEP